MYTNGTVSYLEVLLQSTSFADFIERYNVLKLLVSQDKEILESTNAISNYSKPIRKKRNDRSPCSKKITWKRNRCAVR